MKKFLVGMTLLAGLGCTSVEPTGPLAKVTGTPKKAPEKDSPSPSDPVTVAAPLPPRPAELATPGQVTAETAQAEARKLMQELEIDGKAIRHMPRTAEVSVIRDGVKVK